jgi:hypothetical protein
MNSKELKIVLENHQKWLSGEVGGERADLLDTNLTDADLTGAGLTDANLTGANLTGADLRGANLYRATLTDADLRGANLHRANLRYAILCYANLAGADLHDAILHGAILRYANLTDANLTDAKGLPKVVVKDLDTKILQAIDSGGTLSMSAWHTCETTHCRAGWAITLAGKRGKKLEENFGPQVAGTLIYLASTGRVPDFFASDADAMCSIRRAATKEMGEE